MRKLAIVSMLLAAMMLPPAVLGQEPAAESGAQAVLDPGVAVKAPGNATLTAISPIPNILVGDNSEKTWSIKRGDSVRFYYARYRVDADTRTRKGTAQAGTDLYGIYYNASNGASKRDGDWVVEPDWSGLFPLTTDSMLVRAPGTDTWYVLNTNNGSTSKLGDGQIGSADIIDMATTGGDNLYGDELYYLITADDGERQTIRLMEWDARKQKYSLGDPIDQVVPAAVGRDSPVRVSLERDSFIRRYNPDNTVYDSISYRSTVFGKTKRSTRAKIETTYPYKQAMLVVSDERQFYFPVARGDSYARRAHVGDLQRRGWVFRGFRPVGSGVTTGLKDNPLEALPGEIMAAVWEGNSGLRLAPLEVYWRGYTRKYDMWGLPKWREDNVYSTNYGPEGWINQSSWGAAYVAIYPIDIPDEVRRDPDATLAWYNGVYCVFPNGKVDVHITRAGVNYGRLFRPNADAFANIDAAREWVTQAMTPDGRKAVHATYLQRQEERVAKLAEAERQKEAERQAAIQARVDAENAEFEAKGDAINARLNSGDTYGALRLASTGDTRFLPGTIVSVMRAGNRDAITLGMAEAGLQYANEEQMGWILGRVKELRPTPSRSYQAGGSYTPWNAGSGSSSQSDTLAAAQQQSRDNYNSGKSGSYLCGAASFCN